MSVHYQAILWNRQKRIYDLCIAGSGVLYVAGFIGVGAVLDPNATAETLTIRAFGTLALLMLHIILCIGPLARLDRRFLPLLYNRRHLGVATFFVGLLHGLVGIGFYHGFGRLNPVVSLVSGNVQYRSVSGFPFEVLGVGALLILFLMA